MDHVVESRHEGRGELQKKFVNKFLKNLVKVFKSHKKSLKIFLSSILDAYYGIRRRTPEQTAKIVSLFRKLVDVFGSPEEKKEEAEPEEAEPEEAEPGEAEPEEAEPEEEEEKEEEEEDGGGKRKRNTSGSPLRLARARSSVRRRVRRTARRKRKGKPNTQHRKRTGRGAFRNGKPQRLGRKSPHTRKKRGGAGKYRVLTPSYVLIIIAGICKAIVTNYNSVPPSDRVQDDLSFSMLLLAIFTLCDMCAWMSYIAFFHTPGSGPPSEMIIVSLINDALENVGVAPRLTGALDRPVPTTFQRLRSLLSFPDPADPRLADAVQQSALTADSDFTSIMAAYDIVNIEILQYGTMAFPTHPRERRAPRALTITNEHLAPTIPVVRGRGENKFSPHAMWNKFVTTCFNNVLRRNNLVIATIHTTAVISDADFPPLPPP